MKIVHHILLNLYLNKFNFIIFLISFSIYFKNNPENIIFGMYFRIRNEHIYIRN